MPPPLDPRPSSSVASAHIVVADDDRHTREQLQSTLRSQGYLVEAFDNGQQVLERVAQGGVDLVLLDVVMPKLNGLEACRLLKAMSSDSFLPVLLVTGKSDSASRVEGLKIGADDYVCKPFDEQELLARCEAMMRIKALHDDVAEAKARLERLSIHDDLTGLYNYRYLHTRLGEEFKRAERYHDPLACIIADVDGMQRINGDASREFGDAVLKGVADIIRRTVREVDVVARFGADEFLVVLPSTHFAGSVTVAERIWRETIDRRFASKVARPPPVTLSVGVALYPSRDVRTKDGLVRGADMALAKARREGGNRICVFQQEGYLHTPVSGPSSLDKDKPGRKTAPSKGEP